MSKKQQPLKERETAVIIEHEIPVRMDKIKVFPDGTFKLISEGEELQPKNIFTRTSYKKDNGKDKTLNQIKLEEIQMVINPSQALTNFDILFAIDTNTKKINNEKISVPAIQCCEKGPNNPDSISFNFYAFGMFCLKNIEGNNAEKVGIMLLVQAIQSHLKYNKDMKVGIVTDHDLGNINKYNNREIPIYKDFYLPENFTLLYASSDAGKEHLLNILIAECDKESNKFFEEVKCGRVIPQEFKN